MAPHRARAGLASFRKSVTVFRPHGLSLDSEYRQRYTDLVRLYRVRQCNLWLFNCFLQKFLTCKGGLLYFFHP